MSQTIWMQCEGKFKLQARPCRVFRTNASNFNQALLKHCRSLDDYWILENAIDHVKSRPDHPDFLAETEAIDYVFRCAFRYPPLEYGSRFGRRFEPSIWYGSLDKETTLRESAYYAFRFVMASEGLHDEVIQRHYAMIEVEIHGHKTVDLREAPFVVHQSLFSPMDYRDSQEFGSEMRKAGVDLFLFPSARGQGTNIGVFRPALFKGVSVKASLVYTSRLEKSQISFISSSPSEKREAFEFRQDEFSVDGAFPIVP